MQASHLSKPKAYSRCKADKSMHRDPFGKKYVPHPSQRRDELRESQFSPSQKLPPLPETFFLAPSPDSPAILKSEI